MNSFVVREVEIMFQLKEGSQFNEMRTIETQQGYRVKSGKCLLFDDPVRSANKVLFRVVLTKVHDEGSLAKVCLCRPPEALDLVARMAGPVKIVEAP